MRCWLCALGSLLYKCDLRAWREGRAGWDGAKVDGWPTMMLKSQVAGSAALDAKWFWTGVVVDLAAAAVDLIDIWYNLACVQAECWLVGFVGWWSTDGFADWAPCQVC